MYFTILATEGQGLEVNNHALCSGHPGSKHQPYISTHDWSVFSLPQFFQANVKETVTAYLKIVH